MHVDSCSSRQLGTGVPVDGVFIDNTVAVGRQVEPVAMLQTRLWEKYTWQGAWTGAERASKAIGQHGIL